MSPKLFRVSFLDISLAKNNNHRIHFNLPYSGLQYTATNKDLSPRRQSKENALIQNLLTIVNNLKLNDNLSSLREGQHITPPLVVELQPKLHLST